MQNKISSKKIIVGVSGGIAAYKSPDLIRRLREQNFEVRAVMTQAAKEFITPLTLQAVSSFPVHEHLFDLQAEAAMGHIELARFADAIVIAPATADIIARIAHGFANDLLTTLVLASKCPIFIAPAMNQAMWHQTVTQENCEILKKRGVIFIGPESGSQACGDIGFGRMSEPDAIAKTIEQYFAKKNFPQKKILITAGPTQEKIDPVRYISNHSSGKMGFALAESALKLGMEVTLISGPTSLTCSPQIKKINVATAQEMLEQVMTQISNHDIFISAAAVSDYSVENIASEKIKKSEEHLVLHLKKNPDIVSTVMSSPLPPFTVGFAAETTNVIEYAKQKLIQKKLDMIIANDVSRNDIGFHHDDNEVAVLFDDQIVHFSKQSKTNLAAQLMELILEKYDAKHST